MENSLEQKIVLITGASRGIGKAIAIQMSKSGFRVGIHFNTNRSAAVRTLNDLVGDGHALFPADLLIPAQVDSLMENVLMVFGKLDVLVNNAGIYILHPPKTTSPERWDRLWQDTIQINLTAPARLSYLAARSMKMGDGGRIVNITSRGAFRGEPNCPSYGASKAGLNSYGQSLAQAFADDNILVYTVAPGFVETDMAAELLKSPQGDDIRSQSPLNRVATPDEIADVVNYLATAAPAYMTGAILDVNGASYLRS